MVVVRARAVVVMAKGAEERERAVAAKAWVAAGTVQAASASPPWDLQAGNAWQSFNNDYQQIVGLLSGGGGGGGALCVVGASPDCAWSINC